MKKFVAVGLRFLPVTFAILSTVGCRPNQPSPSPAPTVTSVSNTFKKSFTELSAGAGGSFEYDATETLSDGTTRPGASRSTTLEIFPNGQGEIWMDDKLTIHKPVYRVLTENAGKIDTVTVRCFNPGHQVQLRGTDDGTGSMTKFEFKCTD